MSCQCHQAGGPFVNEDPDCPAHGLEAQRAQKEADDRVSALENALRNMLTLVASHVHDTGNSAADRETRKAIEAARKLVDK